MSPPNKSHTALTAPNVNPDTQEEIRSNLRVFSVEGKYSARFKKSSGEDTSSPVVSATLNVFVGPEAHLKASLSNPQFYPKLFYPKFLAFTLDMYLNVLDIYITLYTVYL